MKGDGPGTGTAFPAGEDSCSRGTLNTPNQAGRALTRTGHCLAASEGPVPLPGPLRSHSQGHEVAFTPLLRLAAVLMPPVRIGHVSGQK